MKRSLSSFFALIDARRRPRRGGAQAFELKSPDIAEGKKIDMKHVYDSFGCTGDNVSPELSWSDPPAGTKSFAVSRTIPTRRPAAPASGIGSSSTFPPTRAG